MEFIKSVDEIRKNILTLDSYIDGKNEAEYSFAIKLIQKGRCFVPVRSKDGYRFYPSKFIGYAGNTKERYNNNIVDGDGRYTNEKLNKILHGKPTAQAVFEAEYKKYCEHLGISKIYNYQRTYWHPL